MEILVGKNAGFCYGVQNAVDGAIKELENNTKYCLGEIVHNKEVIKELEEKGLKFISKIDEAESKVIIRAHGIEKEIYEIAKNKEIEVKDYTCPKVITIHKLVERYANEDYHIILCGAKEHPENIGTISWCGNNKSILEEKSGIDEVIENIIESRKDKIVLVSQTTYSMNKFLEIENILKKEIDELNKNNDFSFELVIKNTICKATQLRQTETEEISKKVDYMIIIGGKKSSNTKKLYSIAMENCKNSICIETSEELDRKTLKKYNKIGIMAGASTPQKSINDVIELLKL